jgi:nitrate/nitrite-specific signal transduction histidine kinase
MKKSWWNSLRVKIIAWSFVPTVIILSAVAWFTFYSYQRVIGDQAIKHFPEIMQPKAVTFNQTLSGFANSLVLPIMLDLDTNHELPLEIRAQNILDQAQGLDNFDGGIYFLDQQGKVFKTQPPQPELIGQDWSNTSHFRSVIANPNYGAWTDLMSIGSSKSKSFCVAIAMAGQAWDKVLGAAYYCLRVYPYSQNAFWEKIKSLDLGSNIYVVDRNHQIIYSPDPSEMGKDLSGEAYIQQLFHGESNSGRFRIGSEDMVVSYIPVFAGVSTERAGWFILAVQSWAEVMRPSRPYQQLLLVLLALGVVVPVLVTSYGVKHITNPIQKLIQASQLVTAGQFKQHIELNTGDEIEILADQFNLMSAELDASYSLLEKKVADRTRELAILNSIISVASQSLDIQVILVDALNKTVEQMGFDSGVAFKLEPYPAAPLLVAHLGFDPDTAVELVNGYAAAGQGTPPTYPEEVSAYGIQDLQDETLKGRLSQFGFQLLVYTPIKTKGRKLGFFFLGKHEVGQLSPEELSLLSSIGKQIGVSMENARLYEQAEQAAIAAERHRLARELHDAVTQTLFSANLIADVIPRIWKRNPDEGLLNLEELRQLTRGALAEMRTLLLEMRPESLERSDIKSLLTQLADAFTGRVRVPVALVIQGDCELTHDVKVVFYRVAQEALNNIAKHSGARQVEIHLDSQPGHMNLCIQDDGLGFELDSLLPGHMGIAIMRERASSIGAALEIESQVGQGTCVVLDWRPAQKDGSDEYASDYSGYVSG